ncbi:uncharacterized protein VNE69_01357 [Vairimorpha necatrix]|uniref:Uncharacterized protein n=1 Tax=Vairimorpha necatrix TaxID=6039 RepID=A0AAX4J904_9MICR
MWQNMKDEIIENIKKKKAENIENSENTRNYILDFINKKDEITCTDDNCLVKWYDNNLEVNDEDSLENIDFTSVNENAEEEILNIEKNKNHKFFNIFVLHNLKILEIENIKNEDILKIENQEISFFSYSKNFLEFCKCINLTTDKKSVNCTNVDTFRKIFSTKYIDNTINKFIDKIINDPINYEENDKQKFIIILLYTYLYSVNIKHKKKFLLYEKTKNNIFLIKSEYKFRISYTKDYNIDKWILNLKEYENLYDESNFLNFYYQNYVSKPSGEKDLFYNFVCRINKVILNIEKGKQLHFLKRVFMLHTILYSSVDELQVYKTVIDFFNKKIVSFATEYLKKHVLTFYFNILNNIGQVEIFNIILSHIVNNLEIYTKYEKEVFRFNLLQIRDWSQFIYLVEQNIESFNNISLAMDLLFYASDNINKQNTKGILEIIGLFINIHELIKIDHFFKFIKIYFRHLKNQFLNLSLLKEQDEILDFYNKNTDKISKIILSFQRFVILSNEDNKKEKKKETRQSIIETQFHSFIGVIYKLEDILYATYKDKVKITKMRSFTFRENKIL